MSRRALLLLAIAAAFLFGSAYTESPTVDEPFHLVRGMVFWWEHDTRLSLAHPPLANALVALPAALLVHKVKLPTLRGWAEGNVVALAESWIDIDYVGFRRCLLCTRFASVFLTLALLIYLFSWTRRFYGERAALATLLLAAFHPLLLAHGKLNTTDVPVALFTTIAVGETIRWLVDKRKRSLACSLLATGAALSTKYSAVILPIFLLGAWAWCLRDWRRWARAAGALIIVCLVTINASYLFQRTGWKVERILDETPPANYLTLELGNRLLRRYSPLERLPGGLRIPLPYPFVAGIASIRRQNDDGGSFSWFWGKPRPGGVPGYHALMFLLKSPLLFVALLLLMRRRGLWLAFAGLFLAVCAISHINLGARHALPALPPLLILTGEALAAWWNRARAFALILVGEMVLSTSLSFPEFIGYFNWLAGGRRYGHQISLLAEDWCQDNARAARWLKAHPSGAPLYALQYGLVVLPELRYAGLEVNKLICGQPLPAGARLVLSRGKQLHVQSTCYDLAATRLLTVIDDHIEIRDVLPAGTAESKPDR